MSKSVIPIKPIDFDMAKRHVDEMVTERKIPLQVLTPPVTQEPVPVTPEGQGREGETKPAAVTQTQPSPRRNFTVDVPEYIIDAINQRVALAKPAQTKRYLFLQMCQAVGIEVKPQDMSPDGRRHR